MVARRLFVVAVAIALIPVAGVAGAGEVVAELHRPIEAGFRQSPNVALRQEHPFDLTLTEHGAGAALPAIRLALEAEPAFDPFHGVRLSVAQRNRVDCAALSPINSIDAALHRDCAARSARCLDTIELIPPGDSDWAFHEQDGHWTAAAHRKVAEALARWLAGLELPLPPKAGSTDPV